MSPLIELLVRLRALLQRVPDRVYTGRPVPALSGSVGEHVRHCLDHVGVFATARAARYISYDHRSRSTSEETDRLAALRRIDTLLDELVTTTDDALARPLVVEALLHADGIPLMGESSLARELAFVVHHTIHHFAVIALLLDRQGVAVPARFAHAPSTLKAA